MSLSMRWPSPIQNLLRTASRSTLLTTTITKTTIKTKLQLSNRLLCTSTPTQSIKARNFLHSYRLGVGLLFPLLAFGIPLFGTKDLKCATGDVIESDSRSYAKPEVPVEAKPIPEEGVEEESILNVRDLSFATVAGISVGIFLKKGLKIVAFLFGGTFVLLQYFASRSFININWKNITNSYESILTQKAGPPSTQGGNRISSLWGGFSDFITAGFQSRATLLLGIALGFRLG